jgi:hypothetical protein
MAVLDIIYHCDERQIDKLRERVGYLFSPATSLRGQLTWTVEAIEERL